MKSILRKQLRAARRSLSAAEHRGASRRAAKAVTSLRRFGAGKNIALYMPFDRETDTQALIAVARRRGVRMFLPSVVDKRHARLRFVRFAGKIRRGKFGLWEPAETRASIAPQFLALIVVPLVGVDSEGRRLGVGGGYYDRALSFKRRRRLWRGPALVGLAFECQRTSSSFADSWDLTLDSLATETGLHHF